MKVSVVIPAFNEERVLGKTLGAIRHAMAAFDEVGWSSELIVCDNNSTDRTAAIATEAGALVVFEPVNQISRARNAAAARAAGDWLIFVDADSIPSRELFADVVRTIGRTRCVAGGSTVRLDFSPFAATAIVSIWNAISRTMRWMAGSFIFCEAAAFRELGGFSLELYAAEEIDLSKRLKRLAHRRRRSVVILHDHPILTSGRKAHLYTLREALAFMAKTVVQRGRTLRSARECYQWYDGRR
jgi:glycosyltransferase involved in cell wall biosynthesis